MPLGRRGFGLSGPAWLGWHCWGLGAEGLRTPNPASPRRRTRWALVSGSGEPQPSSRAQGASGSPAPLCPTSSGGLGAKTACVAFLSKGAVGLMWAPRGAFPVPLQTAGPRSSVGAFWERVLGVAWPSLARVALPGPWRRRFSQAQSCFPAKENTLGVGFRLRRAPAKQQSPGSQWQPSPALPNGVRRPGWENGLRCFPEQRRGGPCVCCPRSFSCPFADCSLQELVWCR